METETKNLAALLQLALQKKTFIAVQPAEIINALDALQSASQMAILFNPQPVRLVSNLKEALNVVTGILFLIDNNIMPLHSAIRKTIFQQANQLHKSLKNCFHRYCSTGTVSDAYPVKELISLLSQINNTLKNNEALTELYMIVQPHLEKMIETKAFTFHRWLWWSHFASLCNTPIQDAGLLEEYLVELNFNIPAFTNFLSAGIATHIEAASSISAKSQLLTKRLLKYKTIDAAQSGYLLSERSVKQKIIYFLQTQLQLLPTQLERSVSKKQSLKVNTVLSVPQLALFIRLMIETKILNETNQSAVLKNVASFISTSKAASLSSESLRINYYTPGLAAKNIIKEYLSQMLRLVNSY